MLLVMEKLEINISENREHFLADWESGETLLILNGVAPSSELLVGGWKQTSSADGGWFH